MLESDRPTPPTPAARPGGPEPSPDHDDYVPYERVVDGSFLVAAYRRPDFRVDVTLTGPDRPMAGDALNGVVTARYLFGAPMGARAGDVDATPWRRARARRRRSPSGSGTDRWVFVGETSRRRRTPGARPTCAARKARSRPPATCR